MTHLVFLAVDTEAAKIFRCRVAACLHTVTVDASGTHRRVRAGMPGVSHVQPCVPSPRLQGIPFNLGL